MFICGIAITVFAVAGKNDQQKCDISPELQNRLIVLIKGYCNSSYNLNNNELYDKFSSILDSYAMRGFDILPGMTNADVSKLYIKEIHSFSEILADTISEILSSEKFNINPQPFIELTSEMISHKCAEIEALHCNFVNHYFQTVPNEFSNAMKDSFKKQAEHEMNLNILKISSQIEMKCIV